MKSYLIFKKPNKIFQTIWKTQTGTKFKNIKSKFQIDPWEAFPQLKSEIQKSEILKNSETQIYSSPKNLRPILLVTNMPHPEAI